MTRPIEIIAEIGVNTNGDFNRAKKMILMAKSCGADVAKFQVYDPIKVLDPEHPDIKPWWDLLLGIQFEQWEWRALAAYCSEIGIEFFCSVFDPADVEWLNPLVKRWKIASRSMYDRDLAYALMKTGKPVVVSWGYFSGDIPAIHYVLCGEDIYDLYCVSKYPARIEENKFWRLDPKTLWFPRSVFAWDYWGFSDHTEGLVASTMAMTLGARMIEKHFTLDREMPGPDHRCSLDGIGLAGLCLRRDLIETMRGHVER